ncbi:MAG: AraC family transcriptional regulator [Carboxylicivirga sp.]|jgi:YesN/AraC family two-component response regulator|nr:AraC family transcriptional regulator [Carboxylicivirga sp.]
MNELSTTQQIAEFYNLKREIIHPDILVFRYEELNSDSSVEQVTGTKDFFEITITEKDTGKIMIRNFTYNDINNTICFLSPNQPVKYIFNDNKKHEDQSICILFKATLFNPQRQNFDIRNEFPFFKIHASPLFKLQKEQIDKLFPLFEALYQETLCKDSYNLNVIRAYLDIVLNKCQQTMTKKPDVYSGTRQENITFKFEDLVASHHPDFKSLNDYARALHISPVYLSECIKNTTGRTGKQIIVEYQIVRAKYLLCQTDSPIYEIANQMGFDEVTNFTKFFKKYTQQTPTQFRKVS